MLHTGRHVGKRGGMQEKMDAAKRGVRSECSWRHLAVNEEEMERSEE
jgi:hypothetical protein